MENILGIICEYNPFHNGHLYHLKNSVAITGAQYTVCVMSGSFCQRGVPSVTDKWAKARAALSCGCDLVLELPFCFACAPAEIFAKGAVSTLTACGITNFLSFGSESGDINALKKAEQILSDEPGIFKETLKKNLDMGFSFIQSKEAAFNAYLKSTDETIGYDILKSSNNILAIEYLKELRLSGSKITPVTITRKGSGYNSLELDEDEYPSASALRNLLENISSFDQLDKFMPDSCADVLKQYIQSGKSLVFENYLSQIALFVLRNKSKNFIKDLPHVEQGLENRILKAAQASGDFKEFVQQTSSKRYTFSRIRRLAVHALTGYTGDHMDSFKKTGALYIRPLGYNQKGRHLLANMRKKSTVPIFYKGRDILRNSDPLIKAMFEYECRASDLYSMLNKNPSNRRSGAEFEQNPVITF